MFKVNNQIANCWRRLRYKRYWRNFCKKQNIKTHHSITLPTKRNPANVLMTVECKLRRKLCYKGYFRDFCKKFKKKKKNTLQHDFTSEEKSGKRFDDCGFSFFKRQGASFIDSWVDAACASFEDRSDFYFHYSSLQVITNISSHITQPVKRFSHYVMMCLFGQLHIREKSILTYVFLKAAMSSVKGCDLV